MKVNSTEFLNFIGAKKSNILRRVADGVTNTEAFNQLISLLESYKDKNSPPPFCLIIDEENLKRLDFTNISQNLSNLISPALQLNNHLKVNCNFEITESTSHQPNGTPEARQVYIDASREKKCVLFISKDGIQRFFDGNEDGPVIFLTEEELKSYNKKKDISELLEVLLEYKAKLRQSHIYTKFFAPKTSLKRIFGEEEANYLPHKNLLRNKPEKHFRDDLRAFLTEKMKATFNFSKEYELDSTKRIDINTEDENGNYYFIEIKWMGKSMNPTDTNAGTEYDSDDIKPDAVNQTLNYIKELKELNKTVKLGWLAIFDARDNKAPITFRPYDYLTTGLDSHLGQFDVIADFLVDNVRPN